MGYIEKLYQQISNIGDQEFYLMEPEFCHELYTHIPDEKKPLCVVAFLTIINLVMVQPCHSYFARIYIMTRSIINWLAKYS